MPIDAHSLCAMPNAVEVIGVVARVLAAAILGGFIGFQRERQHHAAGLRTHILVTTGAATFVLVTILTKMTSGDTSRVMQGVVQGIGFLGAGAIIKFTDRGEVLGLTSAASIWASAAIGVACGAAPLWLPFIVTLLVWLVLAPLGRLEKRLKAKSEHKPHASTSSEQ
jgi:putative Mg2+ transporter-C (MgtC) family protein